MNPLVVEEIRRTAAVLQESARNESLGQTRAAPEYVGS